MTMFGETKRSTLTPVTLSVSLCMGFVFGFVLEKGRVFEPSTIVNQMRFKQFLMLKMFLSAVLASFLGLTVLSLIPATKNMVKSAKDEFSGCVQRGWVTVAIGAFILGVGMSIAGACPGTVLAQIGAGIVNARLVFLGGIFAAFAYAFVEPFLMRNLWPIGLISKKKQVANEALDRSFASMALPMAILMGVVIFAVELYSPWTTDYPVPASNSEADSALKMVAWPPYVAGFLIGCNQIPAVILLADTIGSASSYATIVAFVMHWISPQMASGNAHFSKAIKASPWQVVYVFGVILGAFISANLSGVYGIAEGVSVSRSFLGGFLILFGSRIAGGCTSGHGISGMGLMFVTSFIAIPAMFAGGIITAAFL